MTKGITIEEKIDKPIIIRLGKKTKVLTTDAESGELVPLNPGAAFAEGHFGFIIIAEKDNREQKDVYKTGSDIYGVQLDEQNVLTVYENGKYFPWKFKSTGKLIQRAAFNPHWVPDLEKAMEQYGVDPEHNPEFFGTGRK